MKDIADHTPDDNSHENLPVNQEILDTAWKGWDFEVLRDIFYRAKRDPSFLSGLMHPEKKLPLILEDVRIRAAIVNTSGSTSGDKNPASFQIGQILGGVPKRKFNFQRFYIEDPTFIAHLSQSKYRGVSPHVPSYMIFNDLRGDEVLVLYMQRFSSVKNMGDYVVAIGNKEEFKIHYDKYYGGHFNECSAFAVPYSDIEKFNKA